MEVDTALLRRAFGLPADADEDLVVDRLRFLAEQPHVAVPPLATVPDVELLHVGDTWRPAGGANQPDGTLRVATEDLVALVAAAQDRTLPRPILKLGHTDDRFQDADGDLDTGFPHRDGQPALGRLVNVRLADDGTSLRCDVQGVPGWLAHIWPDAYPHRSIEWLPGDWMAAWYPTAARHPLVLTGLALLGEAWPAVAVLADVPALFGITPQPVEVPA